MPSRTDTILHHLRRMASPSTSDAALLARWLDPRDDAAFTDLVARHGPMVYGASI